MPGVRFKRALFLKDRHLANCIWKGCQLVTFLANSWTSRCTAFLFPPNPHIYVVGSAPPPPPPVRPGNVSHSEWTHSSMYTDGSGLGGNSHTLSLPPSSHLKKAQNHLQPPREQVHIQTAGLLNPVTGVDLSINKNTIMSPPGDFITDGHLPIVDEAGYVYYVDRVFHVCIVPNCFHKHHFTTFLKRSHTLIGHVYISGTLASF